MTLIATIREDLRAMNAYPLPARRFSALRRMIHPRHRAIITLRVAQSLAQRRPTRLLAVVFMVRMLRRAGLEFSPWARIGPRLRLIHTVGVVVGAEVTAGSDLVLHQNVTLGERSPCGGQPTLGDRVVVGAGALVLGPIRIGHDVVIGAGALVVHDVPDGASVRPVPDRADLGHPDALPGAAAWRQGGTP